MYVLSNGLIREVTSGTNNEVTNRLSTICFNGSHPNFDKRLLSRDCLATRWKSIDFKQTLTELTKLIDQAGYPFYSQRVDPRVTSNVPQQESILISRRNQQLLALMAIQKIFNELSNENHNLADFLKEHNFLDRIKTIVQSDLESKFKKLLKCGVKLPQIDPNPKTPIIDNMMKLFEFAIIIKIVSPLPKFQDNMSSEQKTEIKKLSYICAGITSTLNSILRGCYHTNLNLINKKCEEKQYKKKNVILKFCVNLTKKIKYYLYVKFKSNCKS